MKLQLLWTAATQPIGPIASNRAPVKRRPALRLVLASQTYTFNQSCLSSDGAGLSNFNCGEIKAKCAFFFALNPHNSPFDRNNDSCFSVTCSQVFFQSMSAFWNIFFQKLRQGFEAVFCYGYKGFVFGRSTFNSCCKIRFDSYCCFSSYC